MFSLYPNDGYVFDISWEKFNKLLAVRKAYYDERGHLYWWFLCDCGTGKAIRPDFVTSGNTKTCGCSRRKVSKRSFIVEIRSAYWKEFPYEAEELAKRYRSMMQRCYNEEATAYDNYGGRGIKICPEWLQSFDAFLLWSLENGFEGHLSIDRIDNYKGYGPDNCRWITMRENRKNMRCHQDARDPLAQASPQP